MAQDKLAYKEVKSEEDVAQTAALAKEIWTKHYVPIVGKEQVDYMLAKFQNKEAMTQQIEEGYEYTLWSVDKPIGYLSLHGRKDHLFISKIYLLLQERGKGYGRQMMQYAISQATAKNYSRIRLTVNKYNNKTIAAYQKLCFEKRRALVADIGQGYVMDDFEMELEITT